MKTRIDLQSELRRCGKSVYVTYFEMWDKAGFDERIVRQLMKQNDKDDDGIKMCIQVARRIAENGLQVEALKVITNSPKVDRPVREKAASLLRSIY